MLGATPVDDELDEASPDAWLDGDGLGDGLGDEEFDGSPGRLNHKRVARVMREHGIRGYQRRRRVRTTIPEPSGQKVPDLLGRDFTAPAPNQRYVGDFQCRRRHWMSYADARTMPMLLTVVQVSDGRRTGRSA